MSRIFEVASYGLAAMFLLFSGTVIAGPRLVCEEPLYDIGEIGESQSIVHTFMVKNVGDAPADMKKFKPSCGCAVLSTTKDVIAPGGKAGLTLKMSLGNQGGP